MQAGQNPRGNPKRPRSRNNPGERRTIPRPTERIRRTPQGRGRRHGEWVRTIAGKAREIMSMAPGARLPCCAGQEPARPGAVVHGCPQTAGDGGPAASGTQFGVRLRGIAGPAVSRPSKLGVSVFREGRFAIYSADHKFVQNIDQHLLESITTSQKKTVYSMKDLIP